MEDLYYLIKRNIFRDNENIDQHNFNMKVDEYILIEIEYLENIIEEYGGNVIVEGILLADLDYLNSILNLNHYAIKFDC